MLLVGITILPCLYVRWRVYQFDIPHVVGFERIAAWLNLENIFADDSLLVCFLLAWFSRISPNLLIDRVIRREFEVVIEIGATKVLDCDDNLARLEVALRRNISKIPFEGLELVLQQLCFRIRQVFDVQELLFIGSQILRQLLVNFADLEILPESSYGYAVVSDIDDLQQWERTMSTDS